MAAVTPLSQLLRWRDLSAAEKLRAVRDAINDGLIVAPAGGSLHVALVRVLIDVARPRRKASATDRAAIDAATAWADCPCEKHREAAAAKAAGTAAGTAAWAKVAGAAWAAAGAATGTAAATPAQLDAIVARHFPSPPRVVISGAEHDLEDETTRIAIALSRVAA